LCGYGIAMPDAVQVRVECYAGHRGEQTPRVVVLGERRIDVTAILDQWLAPDHRYFKFTDPHHNVYIVRHDSLLDRWELTMFLRA
jgi:hypothetical protein